jgi:hypothetical protein
VAWHAVHVKSGKYLFKNQLCCAIVSTIPVYRAPALQREENRAVARVACGGCVIQAVVSSIMGIRSDCETSGFISIVAHVPSAIRFSTAV